MKKMTCVIALAVCLLMLAPAGGLAARDAQDDAFLLQTSLLLAERMGRMAETDAYMRMMTSAEDVLKLARDMGEQDYSAPERALLARMDIARAMAFLQTEVDFDAMPEDIREMAGRRLMGSIPSMLVSFGDSDQLVASSALSAEISCLAPSEDLENAIVLLLYGDDAAYAAFVTFARSGEGIILATGMLTPATEAIKNLADQKNISEGDWVSAAIDTEMSVYEGDALAAMLWE